MAKEKPPLHTLTAEEVWRQLSPEFHEGRPAELALKYLRVYRDCPAWEHEPPNMIRASTLMYVVHALRAEGLDDPRTPPES